MKEEISQLPQKAREKSTENKRFFKKLRQRPPKNLDYIMQELHDKTFDKLDCLECANCCKTTGPLFTNADIERISKYMRQKPGAFIEEYLRQDEEGDMVLKTVPCAFLDHDNSCRIYDVRPKACREFPHTDRKKYHQISHLTIKNVAICPAAFRIVEALKEKVQAK